MPVRFNTEMSLLLSLSELPGVGSGCVFLFLLLLGSSGIEFNGT